MTTWTPRTFLGLGVSAALIAPAGTAYAARTASTAADVGSVGLFVLVVLGVIALLVFISRQRRRVDKEHLEGLSGEADAWVARVRDGITPIQTRLILKDDEHAILEEPSVLLESRAYRVYGGGGTRIGGIYVGGGVSESQQRLKQIDEGTLTLTTKRLMFDGTHENRNVVLSQVMSVKPWADAIEVSTQRRAKSQIYRVGNPFIWAAAVEALAKGAYRVRRTVDET